MSEKQPNLQQRSLHWLFEAEKRLGFGVFNPALRLFRSRNRWRKKPVLKYATEQQRPTSFLNHDSTEIGS